MPSSIAIVGRWMSKARYLEVTSRQPWWHHIPHSRLHTRRRLSTLPADKSKTLRSRFVRLNAHLPRYLQSYTTPLFDAPITHVSAFLILHELTAVVPLFGLAGLFHYTNWLPASIAEGQGIAEGVEKFSKYAKRKGWISANERAEIESVEDHGMWVGSNDQARNWSNGGTRIIVEFATAYAITKALLPLRLMLSVWATPWFASRALAPLTSLYSRLRPAKASSGVAAAGNQAAKASPAGGTNAIGGRVLEASRVQ